MKTEDGSPTAHNVPPNRIPGPMEPKVELPQEEVDAIIRQKRKAREPKACYPCHQRKVKCDRNLPCDSCIKRDHADLCSYERPSKRRQIALGGQFLEHEGHGQSDSPTYSTAPHYEPPLTPSGERVTVAKEQWDRMCSDLRSMEETIYNMRGDNRGIYDTKDRGGQKYDETRSDESEREGIHTESRQLGTVHLGSRSVLAYMMGLGRTKSSQDAARLVLEQNILPNLGLDNETATYPFVDLWSTDASKQGIDGLLKLLPDDRHCLEFFTFYRDVACTIYPVIYDKANFDAQLNVMLQNRAHSRGVYESPAEGPDRPWGVSLSWIGLLFAMLASGCQSSRLGVKERELTSQVYICCAYQALRMTNFMAHPSLEAIQTLLIIGNVLSYNMNPGCSYILLGMTTRMAIAMGLQGEFHRFSGVDRWQRGRVWWALAWQDSHFSMSYDRPSVTALHQPEIPYSSSSVPGERSYAESMFQIVSLTLEIVRSRIVESRSTMPLTTIQKYRDEVSRIVAHAAPHLRDRNQCVITTHHLERLALKLHTGYITSEICRPSLKASEQSTYPDNEPLVLQLRRDCIRGLERTITAFLETNTVCNLAARSWIGIQRAISAAFLLGILEESHRDPRIMDLLRSLETVMAERATLEETYFHTSDADLQRSPTATTASPSIKRAHVLSSQYTAPGRKTFDPTPQTDQSTPQGVHWARSMAKSLQALSKLNAALATPGASVAPRAGTLFGPPPKSSGSNGSSGVVVKDPGSGMMTMATPVTPESSGSSGDWNYNNMVERANEYIQAPLWD